MDWQAENKRLAAELEVFRARVETPEENAQRRIKDLEESYMGLSAELREVLDRTKRAHQEKDQLPLTVHCVLGGSLTEKLSSLDKRLTDLERTLIGPKPKPQLSSQGEAVVFTKTYKFPDIGLEEAVQLSLDFPQDHPYASLEAVLSRAYEQAASGKGKERHATDLPFEDQPMQTIARLLGDNHGPLYQAMKKVQESVRMDKNKAVHELLGAIVYIAGAVIALEAE